MKWTGSVWLCRAFHFSISGKQLSTFLHVYVGVWNTTAALPSEMLSLSSCDCTFSQTAEASSLISLVAWVTTTQGKASVTQQAQTAWWPLVNMASVSMFNKEFAVTRLQDPLWLDYSCRRYNHTPVPVTRLTKCFPKCCISMTYL